MMFLFIYLTLSCQATKDEAKLILTEINLFRLDKTWQTSEFQIYTKFHQFH